MRSVVLASVLVALLAVEVRGQEVPGTETIDPDSDLLERRKLVYAKGNFSIEAPEGFDWLDAVAFTKEHPEVRMFLCRGKELSQIFMVQVYDRSFAKLDRKGAKEFLDGAQGSMEKQG